MSKWYIESMRREIYPAYNKRRKSNLIGHILRRNYFLKHTVQGKIEEGRAVMGRKEDVRSY
jgi:hypothetical protein